MPSSQARSPADSYGQQAAPAELRNYRLHERLGEGELATIYSATHQTLERPVHVHILRRTDWVSASRFQLAARLAARLNHPNLLPVKDAGHDERYGDYLVTPSLDAQPLSDLIDQRAPLDPVEALRIITQVAAALDYLHSQQIVHRDVQPANILLTPQGIVYLTNLSLAAAPDTPADLSSIDEADYLTPYSAPEQRLDQSEAARALDIYGLGAVLYHALTGELPADPDSPLPSLTRISPALGSVDPVIQRMLAAEPQLRYASAEEALGALRHALRIQIDQSTEDMEESRWEPTAEWLENPLETVLTNILGEPPAADAAADAEPLLDAASQPAQPAAQPAGEAVGETIAEPVAAPDGALRSLQAFMGRTHARADNVHRGDAIRRLLNRWSRQGMLRRQMLGQIIQLEQIVSYNIYFYDLQTLYETRTEPQVIQRAAREDDRRATLPVPDRWAAVVPAAPDYTNVKPQELLLPNSTYVFTCTTCGGEGQVVCTTCQGAGQIDKPRKVRQQDGSTIEEVISEACPTCRGYGKQPCTTCEGNGNQVEEAVFTWSRRARLWHNTDDIEGLPELALTRRAEVVCKAEIDPYEGYWHSVAPLDELLQAAIKGAADADADTRLIAAELQIQGVPITEVDYQLNDKPQRLYIIGFDMMVVGSWSLLNPERLALLGIALLTVLGLAIWGLFAFL
jgi:hypothetical protein